jgi:hypothetical protein
MTLSTHTEQVRHYAAIKRRLWDGPPKPVERPQKPVEVLPAKAAARMVYCCPIGPGMGMAFQAIPACLSSGALPEARLVYEQPVGPKIPDHEKVQRIKQSTALRYGVTVCDVESERRNVPSVRARQCAMWQIKQELSWSLPRIARCFGQRDHTTALYAVRRHQARIDAGEVMP